MEAHMDTLPSPHVNRSKATHTKKQLAKIRRRRQTVFRKADEFHKLCDAEVYVLILKNSRFYVYSSAERPNWPPPTADIVSPG